MSSRLRIEVSRFAQTGSVYDVITIYFLGHFPARTPYNNVLEYYNDVYIIHMVFGAGWPGGAATSRGDWYTNNFSCFILYAESYFYKHNILSLCVHK